MKKIMVFVLLFIPSSLKSSDEFSISLSTVDSNNNVFIKIMKNSELNSGTQQTIRNMQVESYIEECQKNIIWYNDLIASCTTQRANLQTNMQTAQDIKDQYSN